jgi:hypothetical protein
LAGISPKRCLTIKCLSISPSYYSIAGRSSLLITRAMLAFNPSSVFDPQAVKYLRVDQSGLRDFLRQGFSSLIKYSVRS